MTLSNRAHYLLLLSLFLSATCNQPSFHTCDHDKIEQNFGFADIEEDMSLLSGDRVLAASPSFRMYAYYDFMNTSTDSTYASYIRNSLVPPVIDYFQAALKVRYPVSGNLSLSSTVKTICEQNTPTILKTGLPTDFFIYYDTFADNTTQIANSKYCYLASGTRRPLVARTLINRNMLPLPDDDVLVHEKNMYTIMHEVIHTLGFGSSLFNYFIDDNGNTRTGHIMTIQLAGLTRTIIDVPPLTNKMKAYYGCSTLLGAVLENDGGSGTATSHFEKKYFNYEAMASGSIFGRRISEFSLAVLEGSGWYYPDYTYAEPFFYGQGLGCSFLDATCNSTSTPFDEYCVGSPKGCAAHGRGGGWCSTDPLTDGCKYIYPSEDYDCENDAGADNARLPELQVYGRAAGSRCFDGNLSSSKSSTPSAFCFKYNCTGSGLSTQVQVQVGKTSILCTKAEKKAISGYYGFIDCPDPVAFCNTVGKRFCPRNCMGRGTCVNNQCQCKPGYKGTDCALNV